MPHFQRGLGGFSFLLDNNVCIDLGIIYLHIFRYLPDSSLCSE